MSQGGLSFGGRFLASTIFRELYELKIPFRVIDARRPDIGLNAQSTSMVIICSGTFCNEKLVSALKIYTGGGGNILLIGGEHRGLLGPLSQSLTTAKPETLPVTLGYGQKNQEIIDRIRVRFCGPLAVEIGADIEPLEQSLNLMARVSSLPQFIERMEKHVLCSCRNI